MPVDFGRVIFSLLLMMFDEEVALSQSMENMNLHQRLIKFEAVMETVGL